MQKVPRIANKNVKNFQSGVCKLVFKPGPFLEYLRGDLFKTRGNLFCTKSQVQLASKGHMLFLKVQLHFPTKLPDEKNDSPFISSRNFTFLLSNPRLRIALSERQSLYFKHLRQQKEIHRFLQTYLKIFAALEVCVSVF